MWVARRPTGEAGAAPEPAAEPRARRAERRARAASTARAPVGASERSLLLALSAFALTSKLINMTAGIVVMVFIAGLAGKLTAAANILAIDPSAAARFANAAQTLSVLRDFSSIMTHSLDAEAMLKQFLQFLREILSVNRAAIFLNRPSSPLTEVMLPDDTRRLRAAAAIGLKPLLSGKRAEDEGLFAVQHRYWMETMQSAVAPERG